ncbi:hypothetical protein [Streptomyces sp. RKAG337]|uniref:hypothetical protein n=1 Tax=Streptomyces sp. RKAG337 TaxID=2893404 RepID=UPI0020343FCB|nr:hypothetical protein [Streptomyces sp. RKAG337]MCM2431058.1 hypothetical protein [Streptomyces sp. RKAG337]
MAVMMTRRGKQRDYCCHSHNPKELDHGTERAREKREWIRDEASEIADPHSANRMATGTG